MRDQSPRLTPNVKERRVDMRRRQGRVQDPHGRNLVRQLNSWWTEGPGLEAPKNVVAGDSSHGENL